MKISSEKSSVIVIARIQSGLKQIMEEMAAFQANKETAIAGE